MPVDRPNRTRLANALAEYLRGEIDNYKFDDDLDAIPAQNDDSLRELRYWLWLCYDDIKRHKVRGTREGWDFLCRILAFLRSDLELTYRRPADHQTDFAPFRSHDEWLAHRHLFEADNLPAYDPIVHAPPPPPPFFLSGELRWRRVAIGVVGFSALIVALIWSCATARG